MEKAGGSSPAFFMSGAEGPLLAAPPLAGAHEHPLRDTKKRTRPKAVSLFGGAEGTRTPDPLHAMQVRYQLRHSPVERR